MYTYVKHSYGEAAYNQVGRNYHKNRNLINNEKTNFMVENTRAVKTNF